MRRFVYKTEMNDYQAKSLHELRIHVEFFNRVHKCNGYDRDYVHRFIFSQGQWICDDSFLRQINLVNGKVILRRIKVRSISGVGIPPRVKP